MMAPCYKNCQHFHYFNEHYSFRQYITCQNILLACLSLVFCYLERSANSFLALCCGGLRRQSIAAEIWVKMAVARAHSGHNGCEIVKENVWR